MLFSRKRTGQESSRSCKMAVRWGAGEETLTTCNMEIFSLDTLDETNGLHSRDTLDHLQSSLDPSILSIFEDTPAIETRGLDDDSEATLLTALTEILDNVDDENLSPFDTLPESDLLSGQKGREHSPLRRLFCLSRSPPEKDALFGTRPRSTGKTLPRIQQRSDGEEEDNSLTPSPGRLESSSDNELLGWEGFPITFEEEGENEISLSLGDLVRHMHPYCMAISWEDKDEHILPEGGILLEVVDQGENGEPILAIPEMDQPSPIKLQQQFSKLNPEVLNEADDLASNCSEHIVVDDEDEVQVKTPLKVVEDESCLNVKDKMNSKKPVDEIKEKSPSRIRKKKKSNKTQIACSLEPIEGRVLRSASLKKNTQEPPKRAEKRSRKEGRKKNSQVSAAKPTTTVFINPKNIHLNQTEIMSESTTTDLQPLIPVSSIQGTVLSNPNAEISQPACPLKVENVQEPETRQKLSPPVFEKPQSPVADLIASKSDLSVSPQVQSPQVVAEPPPLLPSVPAEPRPKSLSLAEYRRLREQKKPAPKTKDNDNSTKWPSLPEPPKELPPIPYLPDPSPKDPRRSRPPSAKEIEEIKPAWLPRGPGAPPTPEALLAPPAYMAASSSKVSAATNVSKSQQTHSEKVPTQNSTFPNSSNAAPNIYIEKAPKEDDKVVEGSQCNPPPTTTEVIKPTSNVVTPSVYHNTAAPDITGSNSSKKSNKPIDSGSQVSCAPVNVSKSPKQTESGMTKRKSATHQVEAKSPTQELIEAFTSEMGIEATDLTSLLEQFEETQAKEEQCVPEVSGRAAAVGNSGIELVSERMIERVRANDLSTTADLTPPATPPHLLWKPLAPVSLLGKSKAAETLKLGLSKVIEIEARPLPTAKSRTKFAAAASVAPDLACKDHDYCLPNTGSSSGEPGKRWNVKQNSAITIKPILQPATPNLQSAQSPAVQSTTTCAAKTQEYPQTEKLHDKTSNLENSSVLETPDASPTREDPKVPASLRRVPFERSYRQRATSRSPSPKEGKRGRSRVRRSCSSSSSRSNSSESDSCSSRSRSRSFSPPRKRYRVSHSRSSSRSLSRSSSQSSSSSMSRSPPRRRRHSYCSSRSGSWSRSRSRSQSPPTRAHWERKRQQYSTSNRNSNESSVNTNHELKRRKEKAIEERRVVYVGRIRGTMTQKELKERFSYFGEIEECTLHFRDHGDNYGFVTYYDTNNAFMAIENGSKLRKPDELPFDLCFGGRRQFCQTTYADLDSSKEYDPLPTRNKYHSLDFDTLLKQAQQNIKR